MTAMRHGLIWKARKGFCLVLSLILMAAGGADLPAARAESEIPVPVFSRPSGFYEEPFELTVSSERGLSVYYTLDGSLPDETDSLYTGSLTISDRSQEPNVLSARTDISPPDLQRKETELPVPVELLSEEPFPPELLLLALSFS